MRSRGKRSFTGAWVENAKDLVFDSTLTRGAAFPTTAHDPWSILRRNYTGSHLLFHMLFLVATLLPYVVRTAAWLVVNRVQSYVAGQEAKLQDFAAEEDKKPPEERGIKFGSGAIGITIDDNTRKRLAQTKPCLAANCTSTPVWKLLLGLDLPFPYWVLPLCSGMWGLMRMILIFKIGPLSDLEDRSGFTPAWPRRQVSLRASPEIELRGHENSWRQWMTGYRWLYYLHVVSWVPWTGAILSLIYEVISWLARPIWLPT